MLSFILALWLAASFRTTASVDHHNVKVTLTVPAEVVAARVSITNEDYERSSDVEMVSGRMTYWVNWRDVPSGEYAVGGTALKRDGRLATLPQVRLFVR
jgi:hypothetical protein